VKTLAAALAFALPFRPTGPYKYYNRPNQFLGGIQILGYENMKVESGSRKDKKNEALIWIPPLNEPK